MTRKTPKRNSQRRRRMEQHLLRATGDDLRTVRRHGFRLVNPKLY